jgi:hypothetical protein
MPLVQPHDDIHQRSRWMMRAMEWNEPRARYPNLWHAGMPRQVLTFDRLAARLRLGDLIAVFYPASTRHPERSNRFLGLSRVSALRHADQPGHAWVELETAHAFTKPLDLGRAPRRVFMCCDPGWPAEDVTLFNEVFDRAVAAGFEPAPEETLAAPPDGRPAHAALPATTRAPAAPAPRRERPERMFAGADYSGNMRDPRDGTWLALLGQHGERLSVFRLEATGRSGLESALRNPDTYLMRAEAIGLGFPFGLPLAFAETLLGGAFPAEGWWALARRLEQVTWPDYLVALHAFRDTHGEIKRLADERAGAESPLHRVDPDLGSRCYHGIRMIAEDRSRFAVRPFETAQGHRLFEVSPDAALARLGLAGASAERILAALGGLAHLPVDVPQQFHRACLERRDALDALLAARCAAVALLSGEADRSADELAPEDGLRVRREGWIYGLEEPA